MGPSAERIDTIPCDEALARTRRLATRSLEGERARELRAHIAGCEECARSYREAMGTAALLGSSTRTAREERLRRARRDLRRREALSLGAHQGGRERWFRLRTILLPALFFYLILSVLGVGARGARIELVTHTGPLLLDGEVVEAGDERRVLPGGTWCETGAGARASLGLSGGALQLEADTHLYVEDVERARFRLHSGALSVVGDAAFVTVLGFVEVEGASGRIALDDTGLLLEPLRGAWTVVDSQGRRTLEPGTAVVLGP